MGVGIEATKMPVGAKVSVVGAGSLRCGSPVLANIFNLPLSEETEVFLCDPHEEALDLLDRLARTFAAAQDFENTIVSTPDLDDALEDSSTIILCFGLGKSRRQHDDWSSSCQPTLSAKLAGEARAVLLNPTFERVNECLFRLEPDVSVINLVSPTELSAQLLAFQAIHLDWPAPLPADARVSAAHQILRWVRGDEPLFTELQREADGPLVKALLDKKPTPENRFNTKAIATWVSEIEEAMPGCGVALLG